MSVKSRTAPAHRNRTFLITMNNPPITKEEFLDTCKTHKADAAKVALEKGDTGTVHLQAYIRFKEAKTILWMSKRFKGCHVEGVHSPTKAWDYPGDTEKSGSVIEAAI